MDKDQSQSFVVNEKDKKFSFQKYAFQLDSVYFLNNMQSVDCQGTKARRQVTEVCPLTRKRKTRHVCFQMSKYNF